MLNCDETEETRVILGEINKLYRAAMELNISGESTELSRMVTSYIPNIRQSYGYFVDRCNEME